MLCTQQEICAKAIKEINADIRMTYFKIFEEITAKS